jgi:hypothetical protein
MRILSDKQTIAWMKTKMIRGRSYYERWIHPLLDLNAGTYYAMRPPGDSPALMPMDASLNKDVDDAFNDHCGFTLHLPDDDPRKFSLSTPARGASSYIRLYNPPPEVRGPGDPEIGAPTSTRIIQDTNRVLKSLRTIMEHRGIKVKGLGNNKGCRHTLGIALPRGGRREKGPPPSDKWIHPDARAPKIAQRGVSEARAAGGGG